MSTSVKDVNSSLSWHPVPLRRPNFNRVRAQREHAFLSVAPHVFLNQRQAEFP